MNKRFTGPALLIFALFAPCWLRAEVVPAGALLIVRTLDPISSSNSAGTRFAARLDANLVVKGKVVAPAGTNVYGRVNSSQSAGRAFGRSTLSISLTDISINGKLVRIATSSSMHSGAPSGGKTARGAGAGALIGAAFDGGRGAGRGAAIGAGASLLKPGETISVPAGALLDFRLASPVTL
jgi:hypothetical protein